MDKAVEVKHLSKTFKLPLEKQSTLKSVVVNFYRAQRKYQIQNALKNINFEVKKGEFYGIIGRNGSGKSTLLKLLAGIYYPTSGGITISGNLTPFIELGVGFNPELTGRENIYLNGSLLGFSRKEMRRMYNDIVEFAELEHFMDQKLKNYSSGMQVRLAFSIAIRAQSDILLIDEVLAVGDLLFQQKCYDTFKEIKRQGRTVIFVSHDLGAIDSFCDRVMLLDSGKQINIGTPKEIIAEYKSLLDERDLNRRIGSKQAKHVVSSGNLNITEAEIFVNNRPVKTVKEGQPFAVRVYYDAKKPFAKPTFGLGVMNSQNESILGPSTKDSEFPIDMIQGKGWVEASFGTNVLSPGVYTVRAAVADESGAAVEDFVENLCTFRISGKIRYGQINVEPSWSLHSKEDKK